MYNVMLVDDDPLVLVDLKKMIDWDTLECNLVAEANNGKSALELLKEYKIDIVFTDISMPTMTGVELINYINEMDEQIQVVALSAYEDFDYVRESLKNGAKDYLLKHRITHESINGLIKTMIQEIGEARRDQIKGMTEKLSRDDQLIKIVHHYTEIDHPDALLKKLKLMWLHEDLIVAIGGMDCHYHESNEKRPDELTVKIIIDETIKYYRDYFILSLEPGIFALTLCAKDMSRNELEGVITQIQSSLIKLCNLELSFAISERFRGIELLSKQIQVNKTILLDQYFQGNSKFIVHRDTIEEPDKILDDDQLNQLNEALYLKESNVIEFYERLFEDLTNRHLSKVWVQALYMEIVMVLKRKANNLQLDDKVIFNNWQPYKTWLSFSTYEDIKKYLIHISMKMQRELREKGYSFNKYSISDKAMKYIEENYTEKLTLRQVADALLVSTSYLSRTFKQSTGLNLVTYVNQIKMKHAREMILQGKLTLQEIAYEIGLQNYNYFYILFKDMYGISPSDYKKGIHDDDV